MDSSKIPTIGLQSTGNSCAFSCCIDNSDSEQGHPELKTLTKPKILKTSQSSI